MLHVFSGVLVSGITEEGIANLSLSTLYYSHNADVADQHDSCQAGRDEYFQFFDDALFNPRLFYERLRETHRDSSHKRQ